MIEKYNVGMSPQESGADIPIAPQENLLVNGVYSLVDTAVASELERLRSEGGIYPSCRSGCNHCCRYHIVMNIAEAQTLAHYIRREFSAVQIAEMRMRTHQWHEWDNSRPGRPSPIITEQTDLSSYDHGCPLLINGTCSVYPVRPVVCRAHFVSSHPCYCSAVNDPETTDDVPLVLKSVVMAVSPFVMAIREQIENAGLDCSRSNMLLPQWLAIEMGWRFAISL
ncbi:MAG: YkgJ family cysteine cluster protein [Desulfobulbaceae bacterium]